MRKNQKNELVFDHVEELLVRISLDLKKEMKGLFGERLDEIHLIIMAINQGELINFSQDGFGRQIFTLKLYDDSELKIQRAMERMPFTHHDVIEEDARWWSILSHKQAGTLS